MSSHSHKDGKHHQHHKSKKSHHKTAEEHELPQLTEVVAVDVEPKKTSKNVKHKSKVHKEKEVEANDEVAQRGRIKSAQAQIQNTDYPDTVGFSNMMGGQDATRFGNNPNTITVDMSPSLALITQPPATDFKTKQIQGVLPGLEVLVHTDQLFIRQTMEMHDFYQDVPIKYDVLDTLGRRLYTGLQTKGCCARRCCEGCCCQAFHLKVSNVEKNEVLKVDGKTRFCCLYNKVTKVYNGTTLLGSITRSLSLCAPKYEIKDATGSLEYIIHAPEGGVCCANPENFEFSIFLADNSIQVGKISKHWAAVQHQLEESEEVLGTNENNFGISFPLSLNTKNKALLLAALFLLDFQYFGPDVGAHLEHPEGRRRSSKSMIFGVGVLAIVVIGIILWLTLWNN